MALKYAPGLHSHSGGVVLVWHKKSNTLSHSFQTQHHPITITIKCLSTESTTTTTTTTTSVDVSTTVTLCRCRLAPQLLLELMFQVIADNRLEMLQQRPHNTNRTGGLPPISIELSVVPVPSAAPPQLLLPLAADTTPPPPEPTTAPNVGIPGGSNDSVTTSRKSRGNPHVRLVPIAYCIITYIISGLSINSA